MDKQLVDYQDDAQEEFNRVSESKSKLKRWKNINKNLLIKENEDKYASGNLSDFEILQTEGHTNAGLTRGATYKALNDKGIEQSHLVLEFNSGELPDKSKPNWGVVGNYNDRRTMLDITGDEDVITNLQNLITANNGKSVGSNVWSSWLQAYRRSEFTDPELSAAITKHYEALTGKKLPQMKNPLNITTIKGYTRSGNWDLTPQWLGYHKWLNDKYKAGEGISLSKTPSNPEISHYAKLHEEIHSSGKKPLNEWYKEKYGSELDPNVLSDFEINLIKKTYENEMSGSEGRNIFAEAQNELFTEKHPVKEEKKKPELSESQIAWNESVAAENITAATNAKKHLMVNKDAGAKRSKELNRWVDSNGIVHYDKSSHLDDPVADELVTNILNSLPEGKKALTIQYLTGGISERLNQLKQWNMKKSFNSKTGNTEQKEKVNYNHLINFLSDLINKTQRNTTPQMTSNKISAVKAAIKHYNNFNDYAGFFVEKWNENKPVADNNGEITNWSPFQKNILHIFNDLFKNANWSSASTRNTAIKIGLDNIMENLFKYDINKLDKNKILKTGQKVDPELALGQYLYKKFRSNQGYSTPWRFFFPKLNSKLETKIDNEGYAHIVYEPQKLKDSAVFNVNIPEEEIKKIDPNRKILKLKDPTTLKALNDIATLIWNETNGIKAKKYNEEMRKAGLLNNLNGGK